ncbi:MAG TPA: (2Fe-2S)-binding protein [Mycobacteriales bacterium]|nr:(2Fe-2S)-binding protein [Mycobacteriales bacterium]
MTGLAPGLPGPVPEPVPGSPGLVPEPPGLASGPVPGPPGLASGAVPGPPGPADGPVEIVVDGRPMAAGAGASVAATLLAAGRRAWRMTASGQPRGVFCGIGMCFDCTATIDGVAGVRTCVTTVRPGMRVTTGGAG